MQLEHAHPRSGQFLEVLRLADGFVHGAKRRILLRLRLHVLGERRAVRLVPLLPIPMRKPRSPAHDFGKHIFRPHIGEIPVELPGDVEPLASLQHLAPPASDVRHFEATQTRRGVNAIRPVENPLPTRREIG